MSVIFVSLGKKRFVGGTVTETQGVDLSTATFRIALSASRDVPPAEGWVVPTVNVAGATPNVRILKLLVQSPQPIGEFYCWVDVTDSSEIEPLMIQGPIEVQ